MSHYLQLDVDNYLEIRRWLWLATDQAYKSAVEAIAAKRGAQVDRTHAQSLPDFSREDTTHWATDSRVTNLPADQAQSLVRTLSATPELSHTVRFQCQHRSDRRARLLCEQRR